MRGSLGYKKNAWKTGGKGVDWGQTWKKNSKNSANKILPKSLLSG